MSLDTWVYNDGGRATAGFKGEARDCVVRAVAIALQLPYQRVYKDLHQAALMTPGRSAAAKRARREPSPRTGVLRIVYDQYLRARGWEWTPTMHIGSGCQIHLRASELPPGRIICRVSRHVVAVIDGIIHDTHDCSRAGTRCVYGYYSL